MRKKTIIIAISSLLLFSVAVIGARPTYRWIKGVRADQIAQSAWENYLKSPNDLSVLKRELNRAKGAYQMAPYRYDTNRIMGTLLSVIRPEDAIEFWRIAMKHNESPPLPHQLGYIQCLFANGELADAEKILNKLAEQHPDHFEVRYNQIKILMLQGKQEAAYELAKELMERRDTPIRFHLFFVQTGYG